MIKKTVTMAATVLLVLLIAFIAMGGRELLPRGLVAGEADGMIRAGILYLAAISIGLYWLFRIYLPARRKKRRPEE